MCGLSSNIYFVLVDFLPDFYTLLTCSEQLHTRNLKL